MPSGFPQRYSRGAQATSAQSKIYRVKTSPAVLFNYMDYDEALATLPIRYQRILQLRTQKHSYQQIAKEIGITKQGVIYAERRALELIGKLILQKVES